MRPKVGNSLCSKIGRFIRYTGDIFLFICMAFFRMALTFYSHETLWNIVSQRQTYVTIGCALRAIPVNLWFNFGRLLRHVHWFSDYLSAVTITVVYFMLLQASIFLWNLWKGGVSFYWWLKAISAFLKDGWPSRFPRNLERTVRSRPRRALRKLYPGLSRRKILALSHKDIIHYPMNSSLLSPTSN